MKLASLQRVFRDAWSAPDADGPRMARAAELANDSPGLPAAAHVDIYRRAVLGALTRALGEIYPVCRRLVGERFFDGMACAYIRQTPSRSPDLADYGRALDAFIRDFPAAQPLVYLADVARLEWCWHRAFHAADEVPLDRAALSRVAVSAQASLVLRLPVSATLLSSRYPVHRIWQVNQPDWLGDPTVSLDQGAARLLVWRQGYDMRIDTLSEPESWLLGEIARGQALGDIAEQERADALAVVLPRCVSAGWIAGFRHGRS